MLDINNLSKYDNEYIYEKVLTNRQYKYSSHWFENNGYKDINSTFIKKISHSSKELSITNIKGSFMEVLLTKC